jgi:hypothetical protein
MVIVVDLDSIAHAASESVGWAGVIGTKPGSGLVQLIEKQVDTIEKQMFSGVSEVGRHE